MRFALFLALWPLAAHADGYLLLDADTVLSREEVVSMTEMGTLRFYEGGLSEYSAGGSYSYTFARGGTAYGAFTIGDDGRICIDFRNGRSRCDRFVRSHGRLVMLTADGQRFPIRP